MALIDKVFKRILELDGNPRNRGDYGGKAYIRHCMEDHNGQVPLWMLANDLSSGQTVWFFQVQSPAVRLVVAESFTGLYADTHDGPRVVLPVARRGGVLPGECFWAPPRRNIMKPQGVLHFSVPVGEDAERRQGGGTFPDYFWVPVGASWKTRLIGRFPKN